MAPFYIIHDGKPVDIEIDDVYEDGQGTRVNVHTTDGSKPFMILGKDYTLLNGDRRWQPVGWTSVSIKDIHVRIPVELPQVIDQASPLLAGCEA